MINIKIGNIECYGIIYKITNLINGKIYIGQTIKGFNRRYAANGQGIERVYNHNVHYKNNGRYYNKHLMKSIEKYGFDNWEVIEVFDVAFSKEELDIKEKHYIQQFNCIKNGYNHTEGGMGVRLFGEDNPFYGKKHTDETRKKISENHADFSGENSPMYGKHHSEETKRKMSENRKGKNCGKSHYLYNKKISEKTRKKMSENHANVSDKNNPRAKAVICLTTGMMFSTSKEGGGYYNIKTYCHIGQCCRGKQESCGKLPDGTPLVWIYLDDFLSRCKYVEL